MSLILRNCGFVFAVLFIFSSCGSSSSGKATTTTAVDSGITTTTSMNDTSANLSPVINKPTAAPTVQPVAATTAAGLNPEHGKPGHRCDIAVGAPLDSKPAATVTQTPSTVTKQAPVTISNNSTVAGKGLNPEHGKPGHRCDIAVGAPLDSKPAEVKGANPSPVAINPGATIPPPVSIKSTPTIPSNSGAAGTGINPEHGKPGHRCDIAVGAPLPRQ